MPQTWAPRSCASARSRLVRRENDELVIVTPKGEVRCEYVVNAAGYYAPRDRVGKMSLRRADSWL